MDKTNKTYNGVPIEEIVQYVEDQPELVERIAHRKVKGPELHIVDPDPKWPEYYKIFEDRIIKAFKEASNDDQKSVTIVSITHVGSTSVPHLPAKSCIDIDLVLTSNTLPHEPIYVPLLESAGFQYLFREPAWMEHRFFVASEPMACNLHVWGPKCPEVERHRIFRDWLREHADDRELYARTKVECARASREGGEGMVEYTVRKGEVLRGILGRAFQSLGFFEEGNVA